VQSHSAVVPTQVGSAGGSAPQGGSGDRQQDGDDGGYASAEETHHASSELVAYEVANVKAATCAPSKEDWPEFNRRMKMDCNKWARTNPASRLLILAIVDMPIYLIMQSMLHRSGEAFDLRNDSLGAAGQGRMYRILEAHKNVCECDASWRLLRLLRDADPWETLPLSERTLANRSLAFRTLAREVAGIFMLLAVPHVGMPFSVFSLLEDRSAAAGLLSSPKCMRDDFSNGLLDAYPGDELGGPESLAVLASIGEIARTDTANIECGHSFWQREARARSLQTKVATHSAVSATFLMHTQRLMFDN
jgi:hypothetical protein